MALAFQLAGRLRGTVMLDKIFRSNHFARVLALFLAIMLWLFVEGGEIAQPAMVRQTFEEVPLVTLDLEEGYTVEEMPSSVEVTLEGTREALNGVGARDLVAFVDLQGKSPGTYQLPVVVQPPPQVEVVSHNPEAVEITVEELESRDFPLQVALLGRDPVREVDTQIDPEKISIQGATSVLEQVETVMVYADVRGLGIQKHGGRTPTLG